MKNGFTQVPNAIIRSGKKITDNEFRLYCTLLSYKFHNIYVFPGRERLAKDMGSSRSRVDDVKKKLEDKGAFRKKRRGQGKTNIYYLNNEFLSEDEDLEMGRQDDSKVGGKKEEGNKTKLNNYLQTSSSFKETNFGGETQPLPETQPKSQPPSDIVFRFQLNKQKKTVDALLNRLTDAELDEKYELSRNTSAAIRGIIYYLQKYKAVLGIEHTRYIPQHVHDCMLGFLSGIWDIEQTNLPVDEMVIRVVNRWFASTKAEENNLRLKHFVGTPANIIFYNCLQEVLLDVGYYREEANADS